MRNLLIITLALVLCCSYAPAATIEFFNHTNFLNNATGLTVVDFESAPRGTISAGDFAASGIASIVNRDGHDVEIGGPASTSTTLASGVNALSSSFYSSTGSLAYSNAISDNIDFDLVNTAGAAGLFLGNVGPGTTAVQFLDVNGGVIAEEVIDETHVGLISSGGFSNRIFYGIVTDQRIATIRTIEGTNDNDGIVYDDVQFNVSTVPEPSSVILIGLGLLFLVVRR